MAVFPGLDVVLSVVFPRNRVLVVVGSLVRMTVNALQSRVVFAKLFVRTVRVVWLRLVCLRVAKVLGSGVLFVDLCMMGGDMCILVLLGLFSTGAASVFKL